MTNVQIAESFELRKHAMILDYLYPFLLWAGLPSNIVPDS